MDQAILKAQNIRVRYGGPVVLKVDALEVYPREVLGVIGPNGAGKSTLLRVLGLLQRPTEGKVYFHGREAGGANSLRARRRMASVFQEPLLLNSTVYKNVALGLALRGVGALSARERVMLWLERLGIAHLASRPAWTLSGGEAQRASLARALAVDPEVLLLDEPFSPLDPTARESFLLELHGILRETGVATVFVTHDRNEAAMLADRVAVLLEGELRQVGPVTEVFARPASAEVASFVGAETIAGVVESAGGRSARVRFAGGTLEVKGPLHAGEDVMLCLRPEDVRLGAAPEGCPPGEGWNRLEARVRRIVRWGSHYRVELECGPARLVAVADGSSLAESGLKEGHAAIASFKASAVHVLRVRSEQ